jgi:osmotically inducible protein OsmC
MITNSARATWQGGLQSGKGTVSTNSGAIKDLAYGFDTRFEGAAGSNPEELIGAAHAGCFAMALSNILGESDIVPDAIDATSTISLSMEDGPKVVKAHLDVTIRAEGDEETIMKAARAAESGCPISQLLDCEITMEARIG